MSFSSFTPVALAMLIRRGVGVIRGHHIGFSSSAGGRREQPLSPTVPCRSPLAATTPRQHQIYILSPDMWILGMMPNGCVEQPVKNVRYSLDTDLLMDVPGYRSPC